MPEAAQKAFRRANERTGEILAKRAPRRSGELARSIEVKATSEGSALSFPAKYGILDKGGVIRAKTRFMTIPISAAVAARGTARQDPGLFVITTRDGRKFLASRQSRRNIEIRWRLIESVRVAAVGWPSRALDASTAQTVEAVDSAVFGVLD